MNSRWMVAGLVTVAIGVLAFLAAEPVVADECGQACRAVKATVIREASAGLRSCKLGCLNATDVRQCRRSCSAARRQFREAAKAAIIQCRRACRPANPCEEQCMDPVRECLAPILGQARACWGDCKAAGREAARNCLDQPDRLACLLEVARQVKTCAQGCASSVRDGAETCKSSFEICKEGCVPSNPCAEECGAPLRDCVEGVAQQAHTCGESCAATARQEAEACLTGPDPAACLAQVAQQLALCANGCRSTVEQQAQECRLTFESCVHDCLPPDPCRDECHASLRTCAAPIPAETEVCLHDCGEAALQEATACLQEPDPRSCLLAVEEQLTLCARNCEHTARQSAEACWAIFQGCREDCVSTGG